MVNGLGEDSGRAILSMIPQDEHHPNTLTTFHNCRDLWQDTVVHQLADFTDTMPGRDTNLVAVEISPGLAIMGFTRSKGLLQSSFTLPVKCYVKKG